MRCRRFGFPAAPRWKLCATVLGASATGTLMGPVSFLRIVVGRRIKPETVRWAARLTFAGLVLLPATMTSALLLVLRVSTHDSHVAYLVAVILAWCLLCWFVLPLWARSRFTED